MGWAVIKSFRGVLSSGIPVADYYAEIMWRGYGHTTLKLTRMFGQLTDGFKTFSDSELIFCETREQAFSLNSKILSAYTERHAKELRASELCEAAIGKISGDQAGKE